MPYVSKQFLGRALEALGGQHPLLLFSVPCMARNDLPTFDTQQEADEAPVRYGGAQEKELLDQFFHVTGAPDGRPYFSPSAGDWVAARYAETSLQRQRKDKAKPIADQLFFETGGRSNRGYAFKSGFGQIAQKDGSLLPRGPVSLLAYGAWLYRREDFASVEEIVQRVVDDFKIDRDDLIGSIYDASTTAIDTNGALADTALSEEAVYEVLGATPPPPPPPTLGSISEVVESVEKAMELAGVALASGIVARVVRAWLVRDIVVLVGAPGTGKTTFAREFAEACEACIPDLRPTKEVLIDPDFDAARLLGYVDLAGDFQSSDFTDRVVRTFQPRLPQVVLLEEWNTAQVENYLGQILHAVESEGSVQLPDGSEPRLPLDALFLATCNSVRDEPETRLPISRPTKRRATVIEMPNILFDGWEHGGREAIIAQADTYLGYARESISRREEDAPSLDHLRGSLLDEVQSITELPDLALETLLDVVEFLFESSEGQQFMTVGLLVDILLDLVFAGSDAEEALGWSICGKLLQQVTSMSVASGIAERAAGLPNGEQVSRAVAAMDHQDGSVNPLL